MATATGAMPLIVKQQTRVAAVAAASDLVTVVARAPFAGTVALSFIPDTVLTGADTDSRTITGENEGQAGAGTTVIATKAFTAGVDAPALDETVITASAVSGATDVAEGDVISFKSTHVGGSGLAQPPGLAVVTFTRT